MIPEHLQDLPGMMEYLHVARGGRQKVFPQILPAGFRHDHQQSRFLQAVIKQKMQPVLECRLMQHPPVLSRKLPKGLPKRGFIGNGVQNGANQPDGIFLLHTHLT